MFFAFLYLYELNMLFSAPPCARAHEDEKRNHSVVQMLLNEAGNNAIFTPIVMSACGAMGPSMVVFLKKFTVEL